MKTLEGGLYCFFTDLTEKRGIVIKFFGFDSVRIGSGTDEPLMFADDTLINERMTALVLTVAGAWAV